MHTCTMKSSLRAIRFINLSICHVWFSDVRDRAPRRAEANQYMPNAQLIQVTSVMGRTFI